MNDIKLKLSDNKYWITYFKAIGIILVVIGHSGAPSSIVNFIGLFHMAMFFFISGYLYKDRDTYNPIKYIFKRVKSLYIPFIIWQILFVILHNIFYYMNIYSSSIYYAGQVGGLYTGTDIVKSLVNVITFRPMEQIGGAMWFLPALFSTSVIFCLIRYISIKIINKKSEYITTLLVLLCYIVGYNTDLPRLLSVSLVALIIFWLGFKYKKFEYNVTLNPVVAVICFSILIVLNEYGTVSMVSNSYPNMLFFIVTSLSGIYIMIYILRTFKCFNKKSGILNFIGNNTVYIMILHFISFKIVSIAIISIYGLDIQRVAEFPVINIEGLWFVAYTVIGILVPSGYVKVKNSLKIR